jgi:hypothetical protein
MKMGETFKKLSTILSYLYHNFIEKSHVQSHVSVISVLSPGDILSSNLIYLYIPTQILDKHFIKGKNMVLCIPNLNVLLL